jgi:small-conductance mechanosensitive channel
MRDALAGISTAACRTIRTALFLIAAIATRGELAAQEPASPPVLPTTADAGIDMAPVTLDGTVLFRVRGVSSLPAAERARAIEERLAAVAADPNVPVDSLQIVEDDGISRILAGDRPILGVVEPDARMEQIDRKTLAKTDLAQIRKAIGAYRAARSPAALRRGATMALVATLLFTGAIVIVVLLWCWAERALTQRLRGRLHPIGIGAFEVMPAEQVWDAVQSGVHALRAASLLVIAVAYAGFILAQFPSTRGLSANMVAFLLNPIKVIAVGIAESIPSLVFLAVLFFVFRVALRIVRLFFDAVERRAVHVARFDPEWAQPTYKFLRVAVVAFGLVVAYPYIPGSKSGAFQGVSLFLGVLFSLGASSSLANIIAGYMLIYRRAFKVGDRVKIGDGVGDVVETRLQVTHLRTVKNEELIIPNSQILGSEVLNYSSLARVHGLILHAEVGIGYEAPWRQVEAMLLDAAGRTPGLAKEPRPFVHLLKLGDFAVTYEVNAYCSDVQSMNELYAVLYRNILDLFNEHGVQIMTPAYEGDPAQAKVVAPGDWYLPPAVKPEAAGTVR